MFQDEGTRSSFRKARDTIISANNSSSSIPDTLASSGYYDTIDLIISKWNFIINFLVLAMFYAQVYAEVFQHCLKMLV